MSKKISILIILIFLGGVAVWGWDYYQHHRAQLADLQNILQQSALVQDLEQNVFAPDPLRGPFGEPNAHLSDAGVLFYTNQNRAENGNLPALKEDHLLDQAAAKKLQDMFTQQYFEHINPQGKGPSDLAKSVGYNYVVIGENLALGDFKDDQTLLTAWMNSPGHRANILSKQYLDIGVAVGQGQFQGQTTWLAVQEFGKPASACPAIDQNLKQEINSFNQQISQLVSQLEAEKAALDASQPQSPSQIQAYNQQVSQYNNQVANYNNLLDQARYVTGLYNNQVAAFNACAKD